MKYQASGLESILRINFIKRNFSGYFKVAHGPDHGLYVLYIRYLSILFGAALIGSHGTTSTHSLDIL